MYKILTHISALSTLLPLVLLVLKKSKRGPALITLGIVLCAGLITDGVSYFLAQRNMSTITVLKCYALIEVLGYTQLYYFISDHKRVKQFVVLSLLALLFIWCSMWFGWFTFGFLFLLEGLLLLTLAGLYFYDVTVGKQTLMRQNEPYFFPINAGILLYFGITTVPFYFEETVRFASTEFRNAAMGIHHFIHIIFNCLLAFGISRKR